MALTIEGNAGQSLRPSPKRKRTDSTSKSAADTAFAPELSSSQSLLSSDLPSSPPRSPSLKPVPSSAYPLQIPLLEQEENEPYTGADSPRSAVARKLEGLDLSLRSRHVRPMPILSFGDATSKGGDKKKAKLDPEADLDPANVRAGSSMKLSDTFNTGMRSKSPPPPLKLQPGSVEETGIVWWSDAEITGHLGQDPDDDGYGINGIGFKPTPAMAAARSMKRRRQVEDWRSRELREERRRRAEGRRRAGSADPGGGARAGIGKRTVRFAS
jgi:hypothetical protein